MTRKSRFDFGRYDGETVHDVMIRSKTYVPYCYFNIPSVSFAEDILDEYRITRIEKPGASKEAWWAWRDGKEAEFTPEERLHGMFKRYQLRRKIASAQEARVRHEVISASQKGKLQTKNHGH